MRRLLASAAACLAAVLLLRLWLELVGPLPGDRWSLRFEPWPPRPQPWRDVGVLFDLLGKPLFAVLVVGPAVALVWRGLGLRSAAFVALGSAVVVPNALLKVLLSPTPLWEATHADHGANYPSGHVAYAVGLAGALAWLAWERGRRDLVVLALGFVVLMGPSRVWTGAHLPSDVVAGYLVGAGWVLIARALLRPGGTAPRRRP
ncbi:phosphatase PAP2 family protein [Patulibacter americanus]|uniref:phosphatase PAP2 family protein n=1 Tax=Patulibacter americanus TaxID=588672 RepID=UPI0003B64E07|nr:phosphatase PAP2 family protein [Patulibacter americanus]